MKTERFSPMSRLWLGFVALAPILACSSGETQTAFAASGATKQSPAVQAPTAKSAALRFVLSPTGTFVLDAGTFVSDQDRRDGYVRGRLLEAQDYPSIVLVPTDLRGVTLPLPTSGTLPIEMTANLTVHGVTRPTTWKGTAKFHGDRVTG